QELDGAVLADVMEGTDVRVRKTRDRARFAAKSLSPLPVVGRRWRQDLDRDGPTQPRVARLVDLAHPSGAECGDDFVRAESRAVWQEHQRSVSVEPPPVRIRKVNSNPPTRIRSPSASGVRTVTASPRTNVPFLLPRSSMVARSPAITIRA